MKIQIPCTFSFVKFSVGMSPINKKNIWSVLSRWTQDISGFGFTVLYFAACFIVQRLLQGLLFFLLKIVFWQTNPYVYFFLASQNRLLKVKTLSQTTWNLKVFLYYYIFLGWLQLHSPDVNGWISVFNSINFQLLQLFFNFCWTD